MEIYDLNQKEYEITNGPSGLKTLEEEKLLEAYFFFGNSKSLQFDLFFGNRKQIDEKFYVVSNISIQFIMIINFSHKKINTKYTYK